MSIIFYKHVSIIIEADWKEKGIWNISVSTRRLLSTVGEGAGCGLHELGGN